MRVFPENFYKIVLHRRLCVFITERQNYQLIRSSHRTSRVASLACAESVYIYKYK